ncbi:MAG: hypothetical protein GEU91_17240 [Rhizobiales bacterium]|nr:hypothetical protein [Hyphomicrobiales bacterium]
MTIIAGFSYKNHPVLLGDALLSRGGEQSDLQVLPTIGQVPEVFARDFGIAISGLRQKVNVIQDQLALAWAGDFVAAYSLAKALKDYTDQFGVTPDSIARIMAEHVQAANGSGNP